MSLDALRTQGLSAAMMAPGDVAGTLFTPLHILSHLRLKNRALRRNEM